MARKSKSQASRPFFTSNEREKAKAAGSGTTTARLGQDSQLAFGQCGLCLSYASLDPVATPAGFVYCRECILTNLLEQKKALDVQRAAYEEDREGLRAAEMAKLAETQLKEARDFATLEAGVSSSALATAAAGAGSETAATVAEINALQATRKEKIDPRSRAEKVADANATSFWAPTAVPEAAKSRVPPPDPFPRDPMGGDFLRAKQLVTVKLTKLPEERLDSSAVLAMASSSSSSSATASSSLPTSGADTSTRTDSRGAACRFMCPACLKGLSVQKVYLLTACGDVVCADCCKRFVVPTKRCFSCSVEVKGKDGIIALRQGGSSFAAHEGTVATASKYNPTLIC